MNAPSRLKARSAARRFADAWEETCPKAVACLRNDLDELLTCFRYTTLAERKQIRTTNAISNDASGRSGEEHGPWAPPRTNPQWITASSSSSATKTNVGEPPPHSP